jgi:hypothetical protein
MGALFPLLRYALLGGLLLIPLLIFSVPRAEAIGPSIPEFVVDGFDEERQIVREYYAEEIAVAEAAHPDSHPVIAIAAWASWQQKATARRSIHEPLPRDKKGHPQSNFVVAIYAILSGSPGFCDLRGCRLVILANRTIGGWQEIYRTPSTGYLMIGDYKGWHSTERGAECHSWSFSAENEEQGGAESYPCHNHVRELTMWMPNVLLDGGVEFTARHSPEGRGYSQLVYCPVQSNKLGQAAKLMGDYIAETSFKMEVVGDCLEITPPGYRAFFEEVFPGRAFILQKE